MNSCARYTSRKRISLYPKISLSHSLRLRGARSFSLRDRRLITAYNQQADHFFFFFLVILGHIEKGRGSFGAGGRDSSSSRFSGLGRSVSVAEWTVPVFVPVPVSCCHTEARRHCFRIECRRSGCAPSLSLSPDLAAQHRGGVPGERESEQEARLHTEPVTPKPFRDTVKQLADGPRAPRSGGVRLSCTCTRPPFVVQKGDSRLFRKHGK